MIGEAIQAKLDCQDMSIVICFGLLMVVSVVDMDVYGTLIEGRIEIS